MMEQKISWMPVTLESLQYIVEHSYRRRLRGAGYPKRTLIEDGYFEVAVVLAITGPVSTAKQLITQYMHSHSFLVCSGSLSISTVPFILVNDTCVCGQ